MCLCLRLLLCLLCSSLRLCLRLLLLHLLLLLHRLLLCLLMLHLLLCSSCQCRKYMCLQIRVSHSICFHKYADEIIDLFLAQVACGNLNSSTFKNSSHSFNNSR